jgi:YEATS domain-containing protein 4
LRIQSEVEIVANRLQRALSDRLSNVDLVVLEEPPFEIEEEGWGEFELAITLYFTDPTEKAVDLYHTLKVSSINVYIKAYRWIAIY